MGQDKAIVWGHPSYVWGFGQERRLELIRRHVPLENRAILDVGCGLGMYVRAFRRFSPDVHGVDIDEEKVSQASSELPNIRLAPAESLPYPAGTFDVVMLHEVIEHVTDDRQAVAEAVRVLRSPAQADKAAGPSATAQTALPPPSPTSKGGAALPGGELAGGRPGGRLILFAPNRLYPFETHGAYWRGQYHLGNIPLVNYLPDRWRQRFCPHVRAYTARSLRQLLAGQPVRIVVHMQIYPGYDKIVRRRPVLGRVLRRITYILENTPLRLFGLSHFLVAERISPPEPVER